MRAQWVPIIALVAIVADDSAGAGWRCRTTRGDARSNSCLEWLPSASAAPPAWYLTMSAECTGALPISSDSGAAYHHSRGSSGFCYRADGTMVQLTSNQPRVQTRPWSLSGPLGIVFEPARTNSALRSQEFDNAAWLALNGAGAALPTKDAANSTTAPDRTVTADTVTFGAVASAGQRSGFYQVATFTGQGSLQVMVKGVSSGGTLDVCGTLSSGPCTSVAYSTTSWTRICDQDRAAVSASTTPFIGHNYDLNGNQARATNQVYIWAGQFEQGSDCTSYIPTAGVAVTRAVDDGFLGGTGFPSTLNATQGCLGAVVASIAATPLTSQSPMSCGAFGSNTNGARWPFYTGTEVRGFDGTNQSTGGTMAVGQFAGSGVRVAGSWSAAGINGWNASSGFGTINATYNNAWFAANMFIGHAGVSCTSNAIWMTDIKGDTTTTRCNQ